MKKIRLRAVAVFGLVALSGGLLFRTSQSVQQAEEKLANLNAAVRQEQDSVRLLNAEWAYLNNPERLEKLSREYLDLMPPQPAAMLTESEDIPAKVDEGIPISPVIAQPAALQSPPAKFSHSNFSSLLKNISKGGVR